MSVVVEQTGTAARRSKSLMWGRWGQLMGKADGESQGWVSEHSAGGIHQTSSRISIWDSLSYETDPP